MSKSTHTTKQQDSDKLWGFLELKDGTEINLEGQHPTDITLSSPIKDWGRADVGDEAHVYVECDNQQNHFLYKKKQLKKYFAHQLKRSD